MATGAEESVFAGDGAGWLGPALSFTREAEESAIAGAVGVLLGDAVGWPLWNGAGWLSEGFAILNELMVVSVLQYEAGSFVGTARNFAATPNMETQG